MTPPSAPPIFRKKKLQRRDEQQQGNDPAQQLGQPPVHQLAGVLDAGLLELGDERRILDARRHERLPASRSAPTGFSVPRMTCSPTVASATFPCATSDLNSL